MVPAYLPTTPNNLMEQFISQNMNGDPTDLSESIEELAIPVRIWPGPKTETSLEICFMALSNCPYLFLRFDIALGSKFTVKLPRYFELHNHII